MKVRQRLFLRRGIKIKEKLLVGLLLLIELKVSTVEAGNIFSFSADIYNQYIWRGQNLNDEEVLQPAISLTARGLTGSLWSNIDLTNRNVKVGKLNEVDLTLNYTDSFCGMDNLNLSAGLIHYRFPNTSFSPTIELYGGMTWQIKLSPTIMLYRDLVEINGSYVMLGFGHSFDKIFITDERCCWELQLRISLGLGSPGYNQSYFGSERWGFNDLTLIIGLPLSVSHWTFRPVINYSTILSENIRQSVNQPDNFWFGLSVITAF